MVLEGGASAYLFLTGWLLLRRHQAHFGLAALAALAVPLGLGAWGIVAAAVFALRLAYSSGGVALVVFLGALWAGGVRAPRLTKRELVYCAAGMAVAGGLAVCAWLAQINIIGEDGRWYMAIGEQIHFLEGMAPSLKGQLGTRPFLLPLAVAAATAFGGHFFAFLEPLCFASCLMLVAVFGARLAGPRVPWWVATAVAVALLSVPPMQFMALYFNPHAEYAVLALAATCCLLLASRSGQSCWLWPFALCAVPLAFTRAEGALTGAGLLVAALSISSLPVVNRLLAVLLVAVGQVAWLMFTLGASFGHGGLTPYQIAIFAFMPAALGGLSALLLIVHGRSWLDADRVLRIMPLLFLAGVAGAAVLHELVWPFSTLRALTVFAAFFANPQAGFLGVGLIIVAAAILALMMPESRETRVLTTIVFGHAGFVLIIAAHMQHQAPAISDSANRMLLHAVPLVFLVPLVRLGGGEPPLPVWELSRRNRMLAILLLGGVALVLSGWLLRERYFLRMIPVPSVLAPKLLEGPEPALRLDGAALDIPRFDLEDEEGLRAAVRFVRNWSPAAGSQRPYLGTSANEWLDHLRISPLYCTDAAQMMMLIAVQQGLPVREIHLYHTPAAWDGNAHTIMEFWSHKRRRWVAVDAQTATLYRDPSGGSLLGAVEIVLSGGAWVAERLVPGLPEALDPRKLLLPGARQMKINLLPVPLIGQTTPGFALGYALMPEAAGSAHDRRVVTTKWAVVALCGALLALFRLLPPLSLLAPWRSRRQAAGIRRPPCP